MMLYMVKEGSAIPWQGEPIDGKKYPRNIEYTWSDEELSSIGLYRPPQRPPIPPNHRVISESVVPSANGVEWDIVTMPIEITTYDVDEEFKSRAEIIAPYPQQVSMMARKILLDSKAASGTELTQDEQDELQKINTALAAIDFLAKRAEALKAMDPIPSDYKQDKYWV